MKITEKMYDALTDAIVDGGAGKFAVEIPYKDDVFRVEGHIDLYYGFPDWTGYRDLEDATVEVSTWYDTVCEDEEVIFDAGKLEEMVRTKLVA